MILLLIGAAILTSPISTSTKAGNMTNVSNPIHKDRAIRIVSNPVHKDRTMTVTCSVHAVGGVKSLVGIGANRTVQSVAIYKKGKFIASYTPQNPRLTARKTYGIGVTVNQRKELNMSGGLETNLNAKTISIVWSIKEPDNYYIDSYRCVFVYCIDELCDETRTKSFTQAAVWVKDDKLEPFWYIVISVGAVLFLTVVCLVIYCKSSCRESSPSNEQKGRKISALKIPKNKHVERLRKIFQGRRKFWDRSNSKMSKRSSLIMMQDLARTSVKTELWLELTPQPSSKSDDSDDIIFHESEEYSDAQSTIPKTEVSTVRSNETKSSSSSKKYRAGSNARISGVNKIKDDK